MDIDEAEAAPLRPSREEVHRDRTSAWAFFGKLVPRLEIVFICQMIAIYVVIGVSLFNLTRVNPDAPNGKFWIALLSSCLGYMLPNPKTG